MISEKNFHNICIVNKDVAGLETMKLVADSYGINMA
jgi:hypothetical protein